MSFRSPNRLANARFFDLVLLGCLSVGHVEMFSEVSSDEVGNKVGM